MQSFHILNLLSGGNIISISGESGTGKTTLALYLVGEFLTSKFRGNCVWVSASEQFPKNRLNSMYSGEKREYLLSNVYVTSLCFSYEDQFSLLTKISSEDYIFHPEIRFIVIDNISHHLRYFSSTIEDVQERSRILDTFYDALLFPLIVKCQRERIDLLLLHEVSFNFREQQNLPFFHKLYDRIKGVNISLHKSPTTKERSLTIHMGKNIITIPFKIQEKGFVVS
ncbi:MAG: AAA family ATPase [Candidatus Thorarchaeota archaeon]